MPFSLNTSGHLLTTEARERELTGQVSGTMTYDQPLDTDQTYDEEYPLQYFFNDIGIVFLSTDLLISIFNDGSIEAPEFIEGSRVYIDNQSRLTVVFLQES